MQLEDKLTDNFRILKTQERGLERLGLSTIEDLLYHFPTRYIQSSQTKRISDLDKGDTAALFGKVSGLKTSKAYHKKIPMAEAMLEDDTGKIKIIWFHQAYLAKMLEDGATVRVEGKVSGSDKKLYLSNPKIENVTGLKIGLFRDEDGPHTLYPVYPETRGVTSNWLYHNIQKILTSRDFLESMQDPIPENILKDYSLPRLKAALIYIHTPQKLSDAEAARKRFAFQEIFFIQLERQKSKADISKQGTFNIDADEKKILKFVERFPFKATLAQSKCIDHILKDFQSKRPMSRLLEGDVGSGKTAVAATAVYAIATSRPFDYAQGKLQNFGNLQTAYMAPTEILAKQHFESFIEYFKYLPINMALITGSGCKKFPSKTDPDQWTDISRAQLLKWVASGEITILIGTHALIGKSVEFKHLALVIVDEQHRFGTAQRQKLANKDDRGKTPHLLSMTATPIPRTLALTLYGDLDLSLLDEMPAGRKEIITEIITPDKRSQAYDKVREELEAGRQAYVICPRISEPDPTKELAVLAKSVKEEAKRLKKEIFPEFNIDILHSKMRPKEKEDIMTNFQEKKIDILVSTSVVEVGVNVENASLIIIEGAERFGLAQLHQLRGRVLRGTHQPYCFIFSSSKTAKTLERLKAIKTARNGFELAEFDLAQRGAGELRGTKQWGISDLGMEAIKNIKMVEAARKVAQDIVKEDGSLETYPLLKERIDSRTSDKIHFE